jgi:DNA polymerase III delta prime subunit
MNKIQAQSTLDKLNVTIENKIVEHRDELGNYNKSIVEGELEQLWKVKKALLIIINK